jgi:hypothetical protein
VQARLQLLLSPDAPGPGPAAEKGHRPEPPADREARRRKSAKTFGTASVSRGSARTIGRWRRSSPTSADGSASPLRLRARPLPPSWSSKPSSPAQSPRPRSAPPPSR